MTKNALDVGCGGGSYAIENLLSHGVPTTLCDYSEKLLELARKQVGDAGLEALAEFVRCSAEQLPFDTASYDLIECMEVLEHLQNPEKAITEFYRVARPGARLLVSVPHPPEWFDNPEHVVEGYTAGQLSALLAAGGWKVVHVEYCMLIVTRFIIAALHLFRFPLPVNPLAALENLVPNRWRRFFFPYDVIALAVRDETAAPPTQGSREPMGS